MHASPPRPPTYRPLRCSKFSETHLFRFRDAHTPTTANAQNSLTTRFLITPKIAKSAPIFKKQPNHTQPTRIAKLAQSTAHPLFPNFPNFPFFSAQRFPQMVSPDCPCASTGEWLLGNFAESRHSWELQACCHFEIGQIGLTD